MRKFFAFTLLSNFFFYISYSQTATVTGIVKDGTTGDVLEGATVLQPPTNGTTTDEKGNYSLQVEPGEVALVFSYIGMKPDTQVVTVKAGETRTFNLSMGGSPVELQTVVIGESRIGVKLQKVTQSADVMGARLLQNNNITNIQQAVTKIPGVTVLDGQMSIRGGSGYAYGAGSRVMLVVDEMPLMTADRGDIEWAFMPVENIEQMEVVKGASTVLYGSSALNGVINVTTAYARDTPQTNFSFFYEGMGKPPVDSFQWWKRNGKPFESPNTFGMNFLHKQKFGTVDVVVGGMMQGSRSHLDEEHDHFARYSAKIRWKPKKLQRLTLELACNTLYRKNGFQFYWQNAANPYKSASGVSIDERYFHVYLDPKFKYIDKKDNQHKIYLRMYRQDNLDGLTDFWILRAEYQFRRDFGKLARLLFGVNNEHWWVKDGTLGTHQCDFGGGFAQAEFNYKWFSGNIGIREEYVRLDSAITPTIPVVKAGVNFEIRKFNYIRASFGQAFRVPSIAERFVDYQLGGIKIRPNPTVKPESGFTAELGYKRSLKIGKWLGYFDAVLFWTEFKNMLEFRFNLDQSGFYFQSQNVAKARIFGWELSMYGEGKIGPVDMTTLFGYTYFYGVDMNDTLYGSAARNKNVGRFLKDAFVRFALPNTESDKVWDSLTSSMLRYRNPHSFKADFDFIFFSKYHFGTSMQYYSYMTKVDKVFEVVIPDVKRIRVDTRNKGDFIWDLRAGYDINKNISINFIVKNVMNRNYAIRVAKPDKPRTFTVQLNVNFGGGKGPQMNNSSARPSGSF